MPKSGFRGLRHLAGIALLVAATASCDSIPPPRSQVSEALSETPLEAPARPVRPRRDATTLPTTADEAQLQAQIIPASPTRSRTPAPGGIRRSPDGVEVNFDEAEIQEVVREVIGNILEQPYTVSPDVDGTVTLSTGGPVSERDLLLILETVLRINDAALVDSSAGYLVVPLDDAIGRTSLEPLGGEELRVQPGTGVTVVPLRFLDATTAAQFIQPLVERPEDVRIDEDRNLILFSGTGPERQNVLETLAAIDADWLANRPVGIFPLSSATPEAVIPELRALFSQEAPADAAAPGASSGIEFVPVTRLNAVIAIAPTERELRQVQGWVQRLDRGRTSTPQFYVYELRYAAAETIAEILSQAFGVSSASIDTEPPLGSGGLFDEGPATGVDGLDQNGQFQAPAPPSLGDALAGSPTGAGDDPAAIRIVPNPNDNSLVVRARPDDWEVIEATLVRLDQPPEQVLIEASIVEVALNDALRFGVQYFLRENSITAGFNSSTTGSGFIGPQGLEPLAFVPGFNFVFTGGNSNITIDALSEITDVRVLSTPSVVVRDNSEAVLSVGDQVPITTRSAVSVEDVDAPIVNNIEYRDTGVILQVLPRINSQGEVSLEIAQEVSRVVSTGTEVIPLTPVIQQRQITSRVNVTSGQTVVLGGLIQESEQRTRSRIPIVGDLPVVGPLFGRTTNASDRTELIVFITPRLILDAQDASDVSRELRDRMRVLRSRYLGEGLRREEIPEDTPLPPAPAQPGPQPLSPNLPPSSGLNEVAPVSTRADAPDEHDLRRVSPVAAARVRLSGPFEPPRPQRRPLEMERRYAWRAPELRPFEVPPTPDAPVLPGPPVQAPPEPAAPAVPPLVAWTTLASGV